MNRLTIPTGVNADFQVEALIGTTTRGSTQFGSGDVYTGQTGDWSNTQTISIPAISTSPSPTPTVPEFSRLMILPLLFSIPIVLAIVRKSYKKQPLQKNL